MSFELDLAGGAEVLKDLVAPHIDALAGVVAAMCGDEVTVNHQVRDRAVALVSVPAEAQAKDGLLTRAAAAAGLEVVARKPREISVKTKASPVEAAVSGDANEAWVAARRAQREQRKARR